MIFDKLFIVQLVSSFVVGGIVVSLISFFAERAHEKVAGLIVMIPSTLAISFFFIGWALSPEAVAEAAPITPAIAGTTIMFSTIYLYLSKVKLTKLLSIVMSATVSLAVWFLIALPMAFLELSNLWISLLVCAFLVGISHYLISVKVHAKSDKPKIQYTRNEKFIRAAFSGSVIAFAVFLSKTFGPFWGAVFSTFPAAFLSTLVILHWHYDSNFLFQVWKKVPIGTLIFVSYPISAIYTFPAFGIIGGTITSYLTSAIVAYLIVQTETYIHRRQSKPV